MSCEICEEKQKSKVNWADFKIAIPLAIGFVFLFSLLEKIGLVNFVNVKSVSYGTAFVVGLIASFSSCTAIISGLLFSMSASLAKENLEAKTKMEKIKPIFIFHIGRLISFFVFGGIIGLIGLVFTLNAKIYFVLNLLIALVMLILGLNLLEIFDWTKKLHPKMPKFISDQAMSFSKFNQILAPFLIGVATFFLPCGFTQSMQIYTLATHSFWVGAITMLIFSLGTLPTLLVVSLSSLSFKNRQKASVFFKSAGLVIIMFSLLSLVGILGLTNINNENKNMDISDNITFLNGAQIIEINAKGGYNPKTSIARADIPTILRFYTQGSFDCSSVVSIPALNISQNLPITGKTDIELPSSKGGILKGSCGMGMYQFEVLFKS